MSALEEWLMELLLVHDVAMLRVEAETKARVLALMILMQKDLVSILANSPELTALNKLGKNALLRESNTVIADYYGRAQLAVDLASVAEVEALAVQKALQAVIGRATGAEGVEVRLGVQLPTENYLRTLVADASIQGAPAKAWWLRQSQNTQFELMKEIRIGAAQGETNAQIVARIVGTPVTSKGTEDLAGPGIMPLARRNAAAVVQNSMQAIAAAARRKTFQTNADITNGIMQVSTMDGHTSLTCIAYSGAQWDLDYEPINGNDLPYNGGVPRHWNCLPADALVLSRSGITGVSKRWFDGEVVVIRTASGRELTSTPNHPILTSDGWVAAGRINVGGNVVCDGGREWECLVDGDHQDMPSSIENVVGAFLAARQVVPVPVPLSAEDFHGDGGGSKIAVVWTESFLRGEGNTSIEKHAAQQDLVRGLSATAARFCGGSALCKTLGDCGLSSRSEICSGNQSGAAISVSACHSSELLFASVPDVDAVAVQNCSGSTQGDAKLFVNATNSDARIEQFEHVSVACASDVQVAHDGASQPSSCGVDSGVSENRCNDAIADTILGGQLGWRSTMVEGGQDLGIRESLSDTSSQFNASLAKNVVDRDGADAELSRNILAGNAGSVFLDDVVSVSIRSFGGHVFNLETVDGWYSANGIVTHNCRSSEVALMKTLREMGIDMDDPEPGMRASSSGPISAKTTFADFLKMKGADYQNEVLGPGRAELFRQGKLTPRDLVDMSGRPLKLESLKAQYAQ